MFLKQVYKHSKWMFVVMILFISGQAVINFNHGAVFSPFYHYGMYSEAFKVKDKYSVTLVEVNGRILRGQDFSIAEWDKIHLPIKYYVESDSNNLMMIHIRNRLYSKVGFALSKKYDHQFINKDFSDHQFVEWYKNYLQQIIDEPVHSLIIKEAVYSNAEDKLTPSNLDSIKLILPEWNSPSAIKDK